MTSPETNPCVLLHGPEQTSLSRTLLPIPNLSTYPADHVLLRIAYVGVCGSDVHFYAHGGVGSNTTKYAQHHSKQSSTFPGLIMGHEGTATILKTGSAVTTLNKGDTVAIEPGIPCRTCHRCSDGRYNLCNKMRFAASFDDSEAGNTPGILSKYYVLPASLCYRLPPGVELAEGVLVEPLAVAVHAIRMVHITPVTNTVRRRSLVVFGAGTVGLLCAAVGCAFGAGTVVLVDIDARKLDFARSWLLKGAAARSGSNVYTFKTEAADSPAENARQICESVPEMDGDDGGADYVVEASGAPSATAAGIAVLKTGGDMVQTGLSKRPTMDAFPIVDLSEKEIHLHGAFRYKAGDFATAVDLLGRGVVGKVGELISEVFDFENYESAWKATRDGKGVGTKNLIRGAV